MKFFSGMCGYVWGLLRRLWVPYVIPRPGVPQDMYIYKLWCTPSYVSHVQNLLTVVDVYNEWSGPCLAMAGFLKKIKLEVREEVKKK